MQRWAVWLAVGGVAVLGCSLSNDLSELSGGPDAGSGGSGASSNACAPACNRQASAGCQNGDYAACMSDCTQTAATLPSGCLSAWTALLACIAESGSFVCTAAGKADLVSCASEEAAYDACATAGAGGTSGTGGTAGAGGSAAGAAGAGGVAGSGGTVACATEGQACNGPADCCVGLSCTNGTCASGSGGSGGSTGGAGGSGGTGQPTCPKAGCFQPGTPCGDNTECCNCDCKDQLCQP